MFFCDAKAVGVNMSRNLIPRDLPRAPLPDNAAVGLALHAEVC
jgi:hypothetical protein